MHIDHRIFPTILIFLDVCAALVYLAHGDNWRMVVYWLAAAVLTFTVTW